MVYPADDTHIRLALLRRELRATMEHVRALVEDGRLTASERPCGGYMIGRGTFGGFMLGSGN